MEMPGRLDSLELPAVEIEERPISAGEYQAEILLARGS
jgi:hypothetical protein